MINMKTTCPACFGSGKIELRPEDYKRDNLGQMIKTIQCWTCHGTGFVEMAYNKLSGKKI